MIMSFLVNGEKCQQKDAVQQNKTSGWYEIICQNYEDLAITAYFADHNIDIM